MRGDEVPESRRVGVREVQSDRDWKTTSFVSRVTTGIWLLQPPSSFPMLRLRGAPL